MSRSLPIFLSDCCGYRLIPFKMTSSFPLITFEQKRQNDECPMILQILPRALLLFRRLDKGQWGFWRCPSWRGRRNDGFSLWMGDYHSKNMLYAHKYNWKWWTTLKVTIVAQETFRNWRYHLVKQDCSCNNKKKMRLYFSRTLCVGRPSRKNIKINFADGSVTLIFGGESVAPLRCWHLRIVQFLEKRLSELSKLLRMY